VSERCARCGAESYELRPYTVKSEPCGHCLRGEDVPHRSPTFSQERVCRECFATIRSERIAKLKAQAAEIQERERVAKVAAGSVAEEDNDCPF